MIRNIFGIAFFLLFTGCYTQFAALNRSVPPPPQTEVMVDSLGDTVNVVPQG